MAKVTINGKDYEPRSLTLPEYRQCTALTDPNEADPLAIHISCGVPLDEAREWFRAAGMKDALEVLTAIYEASGLTEGARKSD